MQAELTSLGGEAECKCMHACVHQHEHAAGSKPTLHSCYTSTHTHSMAVAVAVTVIAAAVPSTAKPHTCMGSWVHAWVHACVLRLTGCPMGP